MDSKQMPMAIKILILMIVGFIFYASLYLLFHGFEVNSNSRAAPYIHENAKISDLLESDPNLLTSIFIINFDRTNHTNLATAIHNQKFSTQLTPIKSANEVQTPITEQQINFHALLDIYNDNLAIVKRINEEKKFFASIPKFSIILFSALAIFFITLIINFSNDLWRHINRYLEKNRNTVD